MQFIDLKAQYKNIEPSIKKRINTVLEHGNYIMGPEVFELEGKLEEYCGVKHCITCANGTDALQMALMAIGIGQGDEVITTSFSFFATAEVISMLGATPVFVDIDEQTFNIATDLIEKKITDKTKAIMPVSLFGQCADMDVINSIASKYNLPVIEDAAQSFGATYKGSKSCNLSTIGCTSFFPAKPLGCYGDGGACFTNNDDIADTLRSIRVHGKGDHKYDNVRIGMNSRLDTIQAAILLEKLKIYPQEIEARQRIAHKYNSALDKKFITPYIAPQNESVWAQYCIKDNDRDGVIDKLRKMGVPSNIYYASTLPEQSAFKDKHLNSKCDKAKKLTNLIFSLPMHPYLSETDQDKIISALCS